MNGDGGFVGRGAVGVGNSGGKGLAVGGTLRGAVGGRWLGERRKGKLVRCVMCVYKEGLPLDV